MDVKIQMMLPRKGYSHDAQSIKGRRDEHTELQYCSYLHINREELQQNPLEWTAKSLLG